jgi:hypothetical protein
MGVEYEHYVYPVGPKRRPSAAQVAALVEGLASEGWLLPPTSPRFRALAERFADWGKLDASATGAVICRGWEESAAPFPLTAQVLARHQEGLVLRWPIVGPTAAGLSYPLTREPVVSTKEEADEVYYELEIQWHPWFEPIAGESVDTPTQVSCACGAALALPEEHGDLRFHADCPTCGRPFDPARYRTVVRDLVTGERSTTEGAYYQFALRINCHECLPELSGPIAARPELIRLCEERLDLSVAQVGTVY